MSGTLGLIGIGFMGIAQARRLIDSGCEVVGFDVDNAISLDEIRRRRLANETKRRTGAAGGR